VLDIFQWCEELYVVMNNICNCHGIPFYKEDFTTFTDWESLLCPTRTAGVVDVVYVNIET
jgi:hypothetical protein